MLDTLLERLPHKGPMLFLDEVVAADALSVETRVVLREDFLMANADGSVSPMVAIELFAQSAAALMSYRTATAKAPPMSGALLGTRSIQCHVDSLFVGDALHVHAKEVWGAGQLAQFECELRRGDELVAQGTINVVAGPLPS